MFLIGAQPKNVFSRFEKKHHSVRYFWKQINKTHTLLSLLLLETCLHFSKQNRSTYFHHHLHPVFGQQKKLTPGFFLKFFVSSALSSIFLRLFFESNRHALVVAGARCGAWVDPRGVSRRMRQRELRVLRFVSVAAEGTCDVRWGIWSLVGCENELVEKKSMNRQSIEVEGRFFFW